ncbi:sirohydrochlorin ferrochelatase [Paenibacillus shirakamiensis]|uniref:Sirohydrochlorin ferrochelatase n=1 Tax=Paenibacillus shirakamiensis TaxID=1265935 RepID=A0ABS4JGK6_9BACL|nr:CbiX/SirB N-terminal domain-containing protein [Paenibacillus shirakamiensis]MBP2000865.1 sirohydrochlorin ferrochelatase [Paenibacillus shirakamiensis]
MNSGVLVISHGSPDASWMHLVDASVAELKLPAGVPVIASFLEVQGGRGIQSGIDALEALGMTDILVIPLFVSSGSTHVDEIAWALGVKPVPDKETDLERFRVDARIHFGVPMDDDLEVARMVWSKLAPLSVQSDREVILLVAHGSVHEGFRQRWEQGMLGLAAHVQDVSGMLHTDYALLNPDSVRSKVSYWQQERGMEVLVAPVFLSEGYFTKKTIPARLEGLTYRYSGQALLPHPLLSQWIHRQIMAIMKSLTFS